MPNTTAADHTCHGARFCGTPAAAATAACPACTPAAEPAPGTLRRTSVYSLRVPTADAPPLDLLDVLVEALPAGVDCTDTHHVRDGEPYVSISYRIPTSDADAVDVAGALLVAAGARDGILHTGLGVHRRIIPITWGACGVPACGDCLPAYDTLNRPIGE